MQSASIQKVADLCLVTTIFLVYWLINKQHYGPAYLTDEISYVTKAAALDIVSATGSRKYTQVNLGGCCKGASNVLEITFQLPVDVRDLEIRVHAQKRTRMNIKGYTVIDRGSDSR